ncbi:MAG: hypothetical protein LH473_04255, partial [Chitinophagales bacterium]|nr:hypothetical protein [Chitinophagales bacterium]
PYAVIFKIIGALSIIQATVHVEQMLKGDIRESGIAAFKFRQIICYRITKDFMKPSFRAIAINVLTKDLAIECDGKREN